MFGITWPRFQGLYLACIQGRVLTLCLISAIVLVSMWLRAGYPAFGVWAPHDDALFVNLARKLNHLKWLGSYDQLTLAKGAFFPIFLSVVDVTGLPLKLTEHFLYLLSALLLAWAAKRTSGSNMIFFVVFGVLALSPLPWMFEGGSRVTREPLYQILTLLVLALATMLLLEGDNRKSIGMALGVIASCFWLTREEGVWLLPALGVLALPLVLRMAKSFVAGEMTQLASHVRILAVPLVGFLAVVLLVNSMNWAKYGVFRNNDLRAGPFAEAYGALARIQANHWQRYVVFPTDARQLAYSVSPAARELAPYLDGPQGEQWTKSSHGYPDPWGCVGRPETCSTEILSGWFVWALRGAVASAGHYRSATEVDAYYVRLAREINQACDQVRIPCAARRDSLAPAWRDHYFGDTLSASRLVLQTLISLNKGHVGVPSSVMTDKQEREFVMTINQNLSGKQGSGWIFNELRNSLTRNIAQIYATFSLPLFYCAVGVHIVLLLIPARVKSSLLPSSAMVFLTALLAAIASRVVLLGFLEATSIPSNNLLYLLPVAPLYLAYLVMSLSLGFLLASSLVRYRSGAA